MNSLKRLSIHIIFTKYICPFHCFGSPLSYCSLIFCWFPAGTWRWNNVEIELKLSRDVVPNEISTLFQRQVPAGLVVLSVPSTARSFRDCTPIYCPLQRTISSVFTPFPPGIEPRAVAWQSITQPLRHASFDLMRNLYNYNDEYICSISFFWK